MSPREVYLSSDDERAARCADDLAARLPEYGAAAIVRLADDDLAILLAHVAAEVSARVLLSN